jgi:hypothetical protein
MVGVNMNSNLIDRPMVYMSTGVDILLKVEHQDLRAYARSFGVDVLCLAMLRYGDYAYVDLRAQAAETLRFLARCDAVVVQWGHWLSDPEASTARELGKPVFHLHPGRTMHWPGHDGERFGHWIKGWQALGGSK